MSDEDEEIPPNMRKADESDKDYLAFVAAKFLNGISSVIPGMNFSLIIATPGSEDISNMIMGSIELKTLKQLINTRVDDTSPNEIVTGDGVRHKPQ